MRNVRWRGCYASFSFTGEYTQHVPFNTANGYGAWSFAYFSAGKLVINGQRWEIANSKGAAHAYCPRADGTIAVFTPQVVERFLAQEHIRIARRGSKTSTLWVCTGRKPKKVKRPMRNSEGSRFEGSRYGWYLSQVAISTGYWPPIVQSRALRQIELVRVVVPVTTKTHNPMERAGKSSWLRIWRSWKQTSLNPESGHPEKSIVAGAEFPKRPESLYCDWIRKCRLLPR